MTADLFSVALGGTIGIVGAAGVRYWEWHSQKRALRAAFRAEIQTILHVTELRDTERLFLNMLEAWRAGRDERVELWGMDEPRHDPVFAANTDKLGLLGRDVSLKLAQFYSLLYAVRIDIAAVSNGKWWQFPPTRRAVLLESSFTLWNQAKTTAHYLLETL